MGIQGASTPGQGLNGAASVAVASHGAWHLGRWQAYKQMVKLQFKLKKYSEMMAAYKDMLTYIK